MEDDLVVFFLVGVEELGREVDVLAAGWTTDDDTDELAAGGWSDDETDELAAGGLDDLDLFGGGSWSLGPVLTRLK